MFGDKGALKQRLAGVKTAVAGSTDERGTPQKLKNLVEAKVVFANYNNERGEDRIGMFFEIGGKYYTHPETEKWCSELREMSGWLAKQIATAVEEQKPAEVPSQDSVDVVPS